MRAAGWMTVWGVFVFGCSLPRDPELGQSFADNFERTNLGASYFDTIGRYRIINGQLNIEKAYNNPLWLRRKLPRNVQVDLDVKSLSSDGDMKVELYGDGESFARDRGAYVSSGYVLCMGGWHNTKSFIARRLEHGREGIDIVSRTDVKVVPGKTYHWRIVRKGKELTWYIDGKLFLSYHDDEPLYGRGHEHFGFNNWEADVWYDNLKITALSN